MERWKDGNDKIEFEIFKSGQARYYESTRKSIKAIHRGFVRISSNQIKISPIIIPMFKVFDIKQIPTNEIISEDSVLTYMVLNGNKFIKNKLVTTNHNP